MGNKHAVLERRLAAAARAARRRMLVELGAAASADDEVLANVVRRLLSRLGGLRRVSSGRVAQEVLAALREELETRAAGVARVVERAAAVGAKAGLGAAEAGYAAQAATPAQAARAARWLAGAEVRGRVRVPTARLSDALWRGGRRTAEGASRAVQAAVRAGGGVRDAAERLLALERPVAHLPAYVRDLQAAVGADRDELARVVRRHVAQVRRLGQGVDGGPGEYTLRSSSRQLLRDARGPSEARLRRALEQWVVDKERYHARVVARTEASAAYDRAYRASSASPWTAGQRWTLSAGHPERDVCDVLASQDQYGLGPGGYPADAYPSVPHPSDLCYAVAIVDARHFERELARLEGRREPPRDHESGRRETGTQWLARQPAEYRRDVLGPARSKVFDRDPSLVVRRDGTFRSLAQVRALERRRGR